MDDDESTRREIAEGVRDVPQRLGVRVLPVDEDEIDVTPSEYLLAVMVEELVARLDEDSAEEVERVRTGRSQSFSVTQPNRVDADLPGDAPGEECVAVQEPDLEVRARALPHDEKLEALDPIHPPSESTVQRWRSRVRCAQLENRGHASFPRGTYVRCLRRSG